MNRRLSVRIIFDLTIFADGQIVCSCGYPCGSEHIFNIHIEHHLPDLKPTDPSGWPERQFETVPLVKNSQRGLIAKGSIEYSVFTTSMLFTDIILIISFPF
jgi:hypothetical protein